MVFSLRILLPFILSFFVYGCSLEKQPIISERKVWSVEQANGWYSDKGWLRGSNFIPSSAINQLEMWQAETFDTITINRELGWAEEIGFNSMRVYLHHAAWRSDPEGFYDRVDQYLKISARHRISNIFTLFDDCWSAEFEIGK